MSGDSFGFELGLGLNAPGAAGSGSFFTDEVQDDGPTPVAITTSIATRQCWHKGASLALAGTYDLTGDPTGMAVRVGDSPWVQLASETIGAGSWSGTLAYPYYAQGTLEVKPINGANVTPAQAADITVSDIYAVCGQSNAHGHATSTQVYTKTNYDYVVFDEGNWASVTTGNAFSSSPGGECWAHLAMELDQAGIPPVIVRGHTDGGSGFVSSGGWNDGEAQHEAAVADLTNAATGGYAALLWDQGQYDMKNGQTEAGYETALGAMLDAFQSSIPSFAGVPLLAVMVGEIDTADDPDPVRNAIVDLIAADPDIYAGPTYLHLDLSDDLHPTTTAQVTELGKQWFRCLAAVFYGGADEGAGPQVVSAAAGDGGPYDPDELAVVFDRQMQNHTDATGWVVEDAGGTVAVISASAATTAILNDTVVLTCERDLFGSVAVSFGTAVSAVGATLKDTGAVVGLPPEFLDGFDAGEGSGAGAVGGAILLEDDASYWVLEDDTSKILLEGN